MANSLFIYVNNVRELYVTFEWLANCCIKKANKGVNIDANVLANSSTMKSITRAARKYGAKYGEQYTMQDDRQAREMLANSIISDWL